MAQHQEPAAAVGADPPRCGIRVLDASSFIAAPVAATVLGADGADVVKAELVSDGDANRLISVSLPGHPKCSVNYPRRRDSRAKRSLAIDLTNVAARPVFDRLVASADVLITKYRATSRKHLHLSYAGVANVNSRLIYASFTGYGEAGADADQMRFETNTYVARSGRYDGSRYDGAAPDVSMPAQGDRRAGVGVDAKEAAALTAVGALRCLRSNFRGQLG
jgi:crotonobetainyl-CoA:carnitine CoA-transferase CaiB-like acyl-CoA transferase